jgi:CubicO group peptidase (beta-lactamase class C family)
MIENPEAMGFSQERLRRIDAVLEADVDARTIPGAVVMLSRHGEVSYWKAFGYRDRDANVAMQRDDIFRIASMTKPITSVAAMMLAEEGKLLLPDPVSKYLPAFADIQVAVADTTDGTSLRLVPPQRPMNVHDLLRHTAGLTYGLFGSSPVKTAYNEAGAFDLRNTNVEMAKKLAGLPLAHQPGQVWDYSMATDLLGRLIEVVADKSLGNFFQDRIFGSLGFVDTGFLLTEEKAKRMAQPQTDQQNGQVFPVTDHTVAWPWESGGAGLYSTAADYLRFCQMLLRRGESSSQRVLAPSTVDLMTSAHLPADIVYDPLTAPTFAAGAPMPEMGQSFGLGFAVRTHAGVNSLPGSINDYCWGGALGTHFWIDPMNELIAIFMSQAPLQRLRYRSVMRQLVYQALT